MHAQSGANIDRLAGNIGTAWAGKIDRHVGNGLFSANLFGEQAVFLLRKKD